MIVANEPPSTMPHNTRPSFASEHDEPVIFNTTGHAMHDRVQLTVSMRQLWLLIEALDNLRSAGLSFPVEHGTIPAQCSELRDQLRAFWEAIVQGSAPHAGAHARALRLSNRDVFHSPDQAGK